MCVFFLRCFPFISFEISSPASIFPFCSSESCCVVLHPWSVLNYISLSSAETIFFPYFQQCFWPLHSHFSTSTLSSSLLPFLPSLSSSPLYIQYSWPCHYISQALPGSSSKMSPEARGRRPLEPSHKNFFFSLYPLLWLPGTFVYTPENIFVIGPWSLCSCLLILKMVLLGSKVSLSRPPDV